MATQQPNDGGPAFPNIWEDNPSQGMSRRDWLAGLAMPIAYGDIAAHSRRAAASRNAPQLASREPIEIADAMIAEGDKEAN